MTFGIIYVVRNSKLGDSVVKIGKTTRSIQERIRELNSPTSNLGNFEPLAFFPVSDIDMVESECHSALSGKRAQANREFFSGDIPEIIGLVERIAKRYPPSAFIAQDLVKTSAGSPTELRTISQRLAAAAAMKSDSLKQRAAEEAQALSRVEELTAVARTTLASAADGLDKIPNMSLLVPDLAAVALDCGALDDDFLDSIYSDNLSVSPVFRASFFERGNDLSCSKDIVLELLLIALKLSPEFQSEYRDRGNFVSEDRVALSLVVIPWKSFDCSILTRIASDWRWADIESELGTISWPIFDAAEATDRFLQTLTEIMTVDMKISGPLVSALVSPVYYYGCCGKAWESNNASEVCLECKEQVTSYHCEGYRKEWR